MNQQYTTLEEIYKILKIIIFNLVILYFIVLIYQQLKRN
jgi:hypothetical protein